MGARPRTGAQRLLVPALVVHLVGARVESRGALLFVHRYWAVEDGGCGEHIEVRNHQRLDVRGLRANRVRRRAGRGWGGCRESHGSQIAAGNITALRATP